MGKQYNRVMLGKGGRYAEQCFKEGFIGADFDITDDLTSILSKCSVWYDFRDLVVPIFMAKHPTKTRGQSGLPCGFLWTVCKGLEIGDIVISSDGNGSYHVGKIESDYYYVPGSVLPHRRKVDWSDIKIKRSEMSEKLRNSSGAIGTCCDITKFSLEIETLIKSAANPSIPAANTPVPQPPKSYLERDLHKLFCNYLRSENIYGKTIYHEQSSTKKDSSQKWVHPDIVGVRFEDFSEEATKGLLKIMEPKKAAQIYSYELKRTIEDDYQLKQYFFQALSNSSWANYGYLVAYEIDDSLKEEMARLNAAFGIGIILLQAKPQDTQILFPAKEKELDYITIDKLCRINDGFKSFISEITALMNASKVYHAAQLALFESHCDAIFKDDTELETYCTAHGIPF